MTKEEIQKNSEHWYNKYKDAEKRNTELENKIADIKANCDLAIEGRDVKIKDLEKENERLTTNEKSLLAERKIIVKENAELKKRCEELEIENTQLDNDNLIAQDVFKENAELKAKNKWYSEQVCNKECAEVWGNLTKATEHIRTLISCLIDWVQEGDKDYCYIADAEQFLKEIEK